MGIKMKLLRKLSVQQISVIEKIVPEKYFDSIEEFRMKKFYTETNFEKFEYDDHKICICDKGQFHYSLFQVCFFENMIANAIWCMSKGYTPLIDYRDEENTNLWEQFYLQPCNIDNGTRNCKLKICDLERGAIHFPLWPSKEEISLWAGIYKRLAVLNKETESYIQTEINSLIRGRRVIGVLCRGTDYITEKPRWHPVQPEISDMIDEIQKKIKELKCDFIYLATEEEKILHTFEEAFPGIILTNRREYYDEFYEIQASGLGNDARISHVHHTREKDNFWTSLEYLSSIYILANCNALIAGSTGGSRMALILNDNNYEYSHLYNLGVY